MTVLDRLERIVGPRNLLVDPATTGSFTTDWTGRWSGPATAVVRPGSTAEVAEVIRACAHAGVGVVPQGGNTGLVGGGVPRNGEVVLSTTRLDEIGPVEVATRAITVGAGVTLARVQRAATEADLRFGVDLAARESATIGGMAATNAGGVHVPAYGPMAGNVRGLEVVLADGSVLRRLRGLAKDTAGYDLAALFVGSEGTLGVITRVALRLVTRPRHLVVALAGLQRVADAVALATELPDELGSLQAIELMLGDGVELTCEHHGLPRPFARAYPCYLLIEAGGAHDPLDGFAAAMARRDAIVDVAVATDAEARRRLWSYRERHTETVNALGVPRKFDVCLPLDRVEPFLAEVEQELGATFPGSRLITWGHLVEGNLHVNVIPADADDSIDVLVLARTAAHGGTISAEHGIGVAKTRWLHLVRDAADLAAMGAIKRALDPAGVLNPGVVLGAERASGSPQP